MRKTRYMKPLADYLEQTWKILSAMWLGTQAKSKKWKRRK